VHHYHDGYGYPTHANQQEPYYNYLYSNPYTVVDPNSLPAHYQQTYYHQNPHA
jgi:hypothetical protein